MTLGTKFHGIYDLEGVRGRCRIVDGHWLWAGAVTSEGQMRMWAPNLAHGGKMTAQNARRAMWQMATGKPIPPGHKVYCTCGEELCLHPGHAACRTPVEHGRIVAELGSLKGLPSKIRANRRIVLARSKVTPDLYRLVLESDKTGEELTVETGLGRTTISRIRTGQFKSMEGMSLITSPFAGLGARP